MSEYDEQAKKFLTDHKLCFLATKNDGKCPPWADSGKKYGGECRQCGSVHGDRYLIKIWRSGEVKKELTFPFWNSQHAARTGGGVTEYDVLACISGDITCPDTFEDFCSEYGYDQDSRKVEALFKRCAKFGEKLRAFFTEDEQEALAEIR